VTFWQRAQLGLGVVLLVFVALCNVIEPGEPETIRVVHAPHVEETQP
jgi:hypothetical protein